jgi:hypothetical protein
MEYVLAKYNTVLKRVPYGVVPPANVMLKSALKKYWLKSTNVRRIQKSKSDAFLNVILPPDYSTPTELTSASEIEFDISYTYALIGESKAHTIVLTDASLEWIEKLTIKLAAFVTKAVKAEMRKAVLAAKKPRKTRSDVVIERVKKLPDTILTMIMDEHLKIKLAEMVKLEDQITVLRFIDSTYGNWIDDSDHECTDRHPTCASWTIPPEFRLYAKDARAYLANPSQRCRTIIHNYSYHLYEKDDPNILRTIEGYANALEKKTPMYDYNISIITENTSVDYRYRGQKVIFVRDEYKFVKWFNTRVKRMLTNLIKFMSRDDDRSNDKAYHEELVVMQKLYEGKK